MAWSFDTQPSSETTLGSLPCTASRVNAGEATRTLENLFMNDSAVPGVLVIKDAGLLGMVSRVTNFAGNYGTAIWPGSIFGKAYRGNVG